MSTDHAFTTLASLSSAATPHVMAAGTGEPPDFAMKMLWYGFSGAVIALAAWANWKKATERRRAVAADGPREDCALNAGISHEQHSAELSDVYRKLEAFRKELDDKITAQGNSLTKVAADIAASRAETKTLTSAVQAMLKLIGTSNKPH